jgi:hypothetical protein
MTGRFTYQAAPTGWSRSIIASGIAYQPFVLHCEPEATVLAVIAVVVGLRRLVARLWFAGA